MNRRNRFSLATLVLALSSLTPFWSSTGTTHVITFGFTFYSPDSLSVAVGDTMTWQGAFGSHPLASTIVPFGASPFSNSSGTTFSYVVMVEGTYNYQCNVHGACCNMTGMFSASITDVDDQVPDQRSFRLDQNFPNPFNPNTIIRYSLAASSFVRLRLFDIVGNEVAVLVDAPKSPGSYTVEFNGSGLASGIYLYRLDAGSFSDTKKLVLMK